jgi:hypothetical protein
MRATVGDRRAGRADAPLNEPAPEQLLRRADHRREPRRDLGLRPERPQRVDVADLFGTARHDRARHPVSDLEDRVEAGRREEAERDVSLAEAQAASFARAMVPRTKPVRVIRSQNFARDPRNVSPNSPKAIAKPRATTGSRLLMDRARRLWSRTEVSPRTKCGNLYCLRCRCLLHLRGRAARASERSVD